MVTPNSVEELHSGMMGDGGLAGNNISAMGHNSIHPAASQHYSPHRMYNTRGGSNSSGPAHQHNNNHYASHPLHESTSHQHYPYSTGHHTSPPSSLYNVYTPSSTAATSAYNDNGSIIGAPPPVMSNNGSNAPSGNHHVSVPSVGSPTYMDYRYSLHPGSSAPAGAGPMEFDSRNNSNGSQSQLSLRQQPQQHGNTSVNLNLNNNTGSNNNNSTTLHHRHWTSYQVNNNNINNSAAPSPGIVMDLPPSSGNATHLSPYVLRSHNILAHTMNNITNDNAMLSSSNVPFTNNNSPSATDVNNTNNTNTRSTARRKIVTRSQHSNNHNNSIIISNPATAVQDDIGVSSQENQISNSNNLNSSNNSTTTDHSSTDCGSHNTAGGVSSDTTITRRISRSNNGKKMTTLNSKKKKAYYPTKTVEQPLSTTHTCPICLDEPTSSELTAVNGCAHKFCFPCIEKWADRENTCPLCKARFHRIDRVHRAPPNNKNKRKQQQQPKESTGRVKNTKKIKNRDQRADISSGNPLQGLFASMEANGHVPQALTQIIFSGALPLSSQNRLMSISTTGGGNSNSASASANQFARRASRYPPNRYARQRASNSASATSGSTPSNSNNANTSMYVTNSPSGSETFSFSFPHTNNNSDGGNTRRTPTTQFIDTTISSSENNNNSVTSNSSTTRHANNHARMQRQLQQQRASNILQQPMFQQPRYPNILLDEIDSDQEYGTFVTRLHRDHMLFDQPPYITRGGETADTALEIHDSDSEHEHMEEGDVEVFVE